MNGRIYDPVLGRMLSPDNYIQNAGATQFYNRYSYCLSNPLKYVDPSGNSTYGYGCNNLAQQLNYNLQMEDNHWFQNMTGLDCQMIFINNNPFGIYDGGGGGDGGNAGGGGEDGQFTYLGGGQFSGVGASVDNKGDIEIEWGTMEKPTLEDIVYTAYYNSINSTNVQLLNTYEHHHKTISMGEGNNWTDSFNKWIGGASVLTGAVEHFSGTTTTIGNNFMLYLNGWQGNQYVTTSELAAIGKIASRGLFVVGTGISIYKGIDAAIQGNYTGVAKSGIDITMGAIATFGGPPGWIIGSVYFICDATGVFSTPDHLAPYMPKNPCAQDNTYFPPPIIYRYP